MRFLLFTASVACLLPFATAFYPYHSDDAASKPPSSGKRSLRFPKAVQHDGFTIPLRRTPIRRDNQYNIVRALPPTQSNSVGVDQDGDDYSYMGTIMFGTSTEEYHVLLDSGASNTWIMGSTCTTPACDAHDTFGTGDSTTLQTTATTFRIVYGTGQVNGIVASDDARFAGFNVPLTFGIATNVSAEFLSYPMDGIMGLGRADLSTSTIGPTIIDVLAQRGLIPRRLYGISLARGSDGPNDGELNLGAPNPLLFTGELAWVPAVRNTNGFWEIRVDNAGVNGGDGGSADLRGRTAILDTGTSFILMPPADAQKLHAQLTGSAQNGETFTVPCDTTQTVQFTLGGVKYGISNKDFVGASLGGNTCVSNIVGRQTFGATQWLVGATFFKNLYTVFDFEGQRVGFGVKQLPPRPASTVGSQPSSTAPAGATAPPTAPPSTSAQPISSESPSNLSTSLSASAPSHSDTEIPVAPTAVPEVPSSFTTSTTTAPDSTAEPVAQATDSPTDAPASSTDSESATPAETSTSSTGTDAAPPQGDVEPQAAPTATDVSDAPDAVSTAAAPAAGSSGPVAFDSAAEGRGRRMQGGQALALAMVVGWVVVG
ncbi:hypothetical protein W97_01961 [Coniosporium apollinis CBS 100218]|uniref:Peptidase A1 domain-containing protein n=1 Tax=Coniosporium apollinis (strain CBS 100218) TaxID=1168221 RepID=R7YM75_CONA1|nr:uncharacterized protein W97_01961 [Coniosporium apollinis CBS 100218]EON62736.1 hypothetical protein W97_01961 [Coniosporium apollinis CBS 100218]